MGVQAEESSQMSSTMLGGADSTGEGTIAFIVIGSVLVILCAAFIIYGLHRRKRQTHLLPEGKKIHIGEENPPHPTDFMNSLATWDRCHSIDEVLENRRRSVWTLEIFENYGVNDFKDKSKKRSKSWNFLQKIRSIPPCLYSKCILGHSRILHGSHGP